MFGFLSKKRVGKQYFSTQVACFTRKAPARRYQRLDRGLTEALRLYSSYVTRDGRPVHWNLGLVTERNLNVRTATLRVGHLARGLYATVTTRIHSTGPPPFSVMPP